MMLDLTMCLRLRRRRYRWMDGCFDNMHRMKITLYDIHNTTPLLLEI